MRKLIYSASVLMFLFVLSTAFYNSYRVSQLRAQVQEMEADRTEYAKKEPEETSIPEITASQDADAAKDNTLQADTATVEQGFYLMEEDGMVYVYKGDKETLYESTSIPMTILPQKLQTEIEDGKYLKSELELYSFLENYSS